MLILAESNLDSSNGIGSKVVVCDLLGLAKKISVQRQGGHFLLVIAGRKGKDQIRAAVGVILFYDL